jgi:hypothetical protein
VAQRDLRAPRPRRPAARAPATAGHLARLAARLTPRDRWLARLLAEHRVLTSAQVTQTAFGTHRAANARLLNLYRWRVVDRFQPYTGAGAAHHHYVLDTAGHALLAAEDGIDPADLRWRPEHAIAIAHSMRLAHTVAVNGFFTALIAIALRPGGSARLEAWWSEDRCARLFADHVRPDAYGRWTQHDANGGGVVEFFLEHDQGTETHTRLTGKLGGYAALATATGISTPVLFRFRTTGRETAARRALAAALARLDQPHTVPVATSAADHTPPAGTDPGPAGPAWLPIHPTNPATGGPAGRLRLAELAATWRLPPPTAQTDGASVDLPSGPAGRPRLAPPLPMPPRPVQAGGGGARW